MTINQSIQQEIEQLAESLRDKLVETRRDFHMHPELSGEEERTAGIVAQQLRDLGLEVRSGVGGHGVIGLLKGGKDGPVVAWRADMDAFPSANNLDVPYKTQVEGVKHICGHDVHTTVGLGTAATLAAMRDDIAGTIKFIFQPAEETEEGALAVIADGGLENPRPDAIFGLHVSPWPVGKIGFAPGPILAGKTRFHMTLHGTGDLEAIAKELIAEIDSLNVLSFPSSREAYDDLTVAVENGRSDITKFIIFMFGEMEATPETVQVQGIIRLANDNLHEQALETLQTTLAEFGNRESVSVDLEFWPQHPPVTLNDLALVNASRETIEAMIGKENVLQLNAAWPFNVEDFAYYQQQIPGVFYFLGASNRERGIMAIPHTPEFDVDEECLVVGTKVAAGVLLNFLNGRVA